ncbi:MAG: pentapeptide repeat-containing protein [Aggregatilineales bacterium]
MRKLNRFAIKHILRTTRNFEGKNLSGLDLAGFNFSHARLWYADLSGANLAGVNFAHADLTGANLTCTNLAGANLSAAQLDETIFDETNLTGVYLGEFVFDTDIDERNSQFNNPKPQYAQTA